MPLGVRLRTPAPSTPPARSVIAASLRPRRVLSACAGSSLALSALPRCPLCLLARAGVAGMLTGKLRLNQPPLFYAGLAAPRAATAWGVLYRRLPSARACSTGACAAATLPAAAGGRGMHRH